MLNLVACLILTVFNGLLEIWPMVAMNVVLSLINLWFIRSLLADRHDERAFKVLEVGPTDEYLHHVLRLHQADLLKHQPDLDWEGAAAGRRAYLVEHGYETVGVVLAREERDGVLQIELDYVTPRFRDFSPGEFVWRRSGVLHEQGFRRVVSPPAMVGPYYDRIGFQREGDVSFSKSWIRGKARRRLRAAAQLAVEPTCTTPGAETPASEPGSNRGVRRCGAFSFGHPLGASTSPSSRRSRSSDRCRTSDRPHGLGSPPPPERRRLPRTSSTSMPTSASTSSTARVRRSTASASKTSRFR